MSEQMAFVCTKKLFKSPCMIEVFFEPGFLALVSRVMPSKIFLPSKKLGDEELKLFQLLDLTFEPSFSFKKIIEGDKLKIQKLELLKLLLKETVDRHELLIEFAEDGQPSDGAQLSQRKTKGSPVMALS